MRESVKYQSVAYQILSNEKRISYISPSLEYFNIGKLIEREHFSYDIEKFAIVMRRI